MVSYKFTIYGEPRPKKNSQQVFINKKTGKPFISQNDKYKQYEKETMSQLPNIVAINIPVNVKATFYRSTKHRVDKSNLEEALHDVLVKHRILVDDCRDIVAGTDGSRVLYDKDNPRTEVEITIMEDYEQWTKWEVE